MQKADRSTATQLAVCLAGLILGLTPAGNTAHAEVLISSQEALLPPAEPGTRGVTRSPGIRLVSPGEAPRIVQSPFVFKVAFAPHGGAHIDPGSIKLIYLKTPSVDLTPRLRAHVTDAGIEVDAAEMPPGEHSLQLSVTDSGGRLSKMVFSLMVGP